MNETIIECLEKGMNRCFKVFLKIKDPVMKDRQ